MISIQEILGNTQNDVNDLGKNRIQLGEYLSMLNEISMDISQHTEVWIGRYVAYPDVAASEWDTTVVYSVNNVITYNSLYYIAIVASQGQQPDISTTYWAPVSMWTAGVTYAIGDYVYIVSPSFQVYRAVDISTDIIPPNTDYWFSIASIDQYRYKVNLPYVDSQGNTLAPYKLIRVCRGTASGGYEETREFSVQAIGRSSNDQRTFLVNDIALNQNAYSTQFLNDMRAGTNTVDNSITFNFTQAFEADETVVIDFIQGRPFTITQWNIAPDLLIPDFLKEAFLAGMTWKAFMRLYYKGDDSLYNRMKDAERRYHGSRYESRGLYGGALREAVGYSKQFRSQGSTQQVLPYKYLPRNKTWE